MEKGADATDIALQERIEAYHEGLARNIGYLTGEAKRSWSMGDFDGGRHPRDAVEGTGHWEEGVSYAKGELGRKLIQQYLLDRRADEAEPRESPSKAPRCPGKSRRRPQPAAPEHVLCPDCKTFDLDLNRFLDFLNPQRYKAAILLELIPAWLRFLESRQLIDAGQREQTLADLREVTADVPRLWEAYRADSALQEGLERSFPAIAHRGREQA